jgi:hypothetical protein
MNSMHFTILSLIICCIYNKDNSKNTSEWWRLVGLDTLCDYVRYRAYTVHVQCSPRKRASNRSRNHERTISLRFLGIILRVLKLEVSFYDVYISNQFQTIFAQGWEGGVKSVGGKLLRLVSQLRPRIRPQAKWLGIVVAVVQVNPYPTNVSPKRCSLDHPHLLYNMSMCFLPFSSVSSLMIITKLTRTSLKYSWRRISVPVL